ncbi:MAG: ABC transporter permease [Butyrivibrio sp.]|nr:ABC transporter permease [Butyrivibrio sp.]
MKRYLPYAITSAKSDLSAEVASSYLNWMWWLIEPVCMMIIYTLIFGIVFRASEDNFSLFVFIGLTMWGFFSRNLQGSVDIVRANRDIVTKIYMPKYILLLARMFVNAFKMMVSFGLAAVMLIIYRIPVNLNALWAIPVMIVFFLLTFGMSSIMMHYGVYVSDLGYIVGILLQMAMYLSGVFYSIVNQVPEPFGMALELFNPVAFLMDSFRNAIMYGKPPIIGGLVAWTMVSIIMIAIGVFTVYSNENSYVKVI